MKLTSPSLPTACQITTLNRRWPVPKATIARVLKTTSGSFPVHLSMTQQVVMMPPTALKPTASTSAQQPLGKSLSPSMAYRSTGLKTDPAATLWPANTAPMMRTVNRLNSACATLTTDKVVPSTTMLMPIASTGTLKKGRRCSITTSAHLPLWPKIRPTVHIQRSLVWPWTATQSTGFGAMMTK